MRDRGFLVDAVAEVEHMRAYGECIEDAPRCRFELGPAGEELERIEVPLHRHSRGQLARGPSRIDRLVDPDRIDAGLARISRQLLARALWKADYRHVRVA